VKFPLRIRFRRAEVTIYGKTTGHPFYRVAYRSAGRRALRSFAKYADAKAFAEQTVRELAAGFAPLAPREATEAHLIRQAIAQFAQATGERVGALQAVVEYLDARRHLPPGLSLVEAVRRVGTLLASKPIAVDKAVEEFIAANAPHPSANPSERVLSDKYAYNRAIALRAFAEAFPNTQLGDLTKAHIDTFFGSLDRLAPKTRNRYRAAVRQFIAWAARKDYLPPAHRLAEADGLRQERAVMGEIGFYTPSEFRALLGAADDQLRPLVAIAGLAGLRTVELLRLDWADVWRVPGHIEVSSGKAKTRQRRLVAICPALEAWLRPYRDRTGRLWPGHEIRLHEHLRDLHENAGVERKANGLRHSFVTYHYALHNNENLTAAQAGNSPAMVHAHYKGLATHEQGKAWFAVAPESAAQP
jgi:integrase